LTDGFGAIKENIKKMNACLALSAHSWSTSKFVITWASASWYQEDLEQPEKTKGQRVERLRW